MPSSSAGGSGSGRPREDVTWVGVVTWMSPCSTHGATVSLFLELLCS